MLGERLRLHTFHRSEGERWDGRWSLWLGEPYEGRELLRGEIDRRTRVQIGAGFCVHPDDREISCSVSLGRALYLTIPARWLPRRGRSRRTELRFTWDAADGAWLWARLLSDEWESCSSRRESLRRGLGLDLSTSLSRRLLGDSNYTSLTLVQDRVVIEMPEGGYPYLVRVAEDVWAWPRWPRPLRITRLHCTALETPAPDYTRKGWRTLDGMTAPLRIRPDCTWDQAGRWPSPPVGGQRELLRVAKRQIELGLLTNRLVYGGLRAVLGPDVAGV